MTQPLILSRSRLADYLVCRRRFQLHYLDRLAWPVGSPTDEAEKARQLGQRFHQELQRHFLGLPVRQEPGSDPILGQWLDRFLSAPPAIPEGKRYPELTLTVPIGDHFLTGRFDLLVVGEEQAHLYDWKTDSRPRPRAELRQDLQTTLYLALAAEGSSAIGDPLLPEQIRLTYWYINAERPAITFGYDREWHGKNWDYLRGMVADIALQADSGDDLALTEDWTACARCAYQLYCGRSTGEMDLSEWERDTQPASMEPEIP